MKRGKNFSRLFAILAIAFILFQSFAFPVLAVESWTGNKWEGNEWQGNEWEGNEWQGNEWKGNEWEGNEWKGNEWQGNEWEGQNWQGNNVDGGNTWNGNQWQGSNWSNSPWNGAPFNGNTWNGNQWNGTPSNGNSWNGTPFNSSPFGNPYGNIPGVNGAPYGPVVGAMPNGTGNQEGTDSNGVDPYKVTKYIGDTVINGQVKMIADSIKDPAKFNTNFLTRPNYLTRVAASGFKLGMEGSVPADLLLYGHDGVDKFNKAKDSLNSLRQIRDAASQASNVGDLANVAVGETIDKASTFSKMAPLSKLNFATAGISAGFAAVDTYKAYESLQAAKTGQQKAEAAGGMIASGGDFLMNAGTMMAAVPIPAVQAVGAGIVIAGGILWGAGTLTKLAARHWDKITGAAKKFVTWRENTKRKIIDGGVKLLKAGLKSLFSR